VAIAISFVVGRPIAGPHDVHERDGGFRHRDRIFLQVSIEMIERPQPIRIR
jgi:hypothetical protein